MVQPEPEMLVSGVLLEADPR